MSISLHHVQVSCPPGGEDSARLFYRDGLGMEEVDKPSVLAARGGAWFRYSQEGHTTAEIHVGVEANFVPAKKAHPAFLLPDEESLLMTGEKLVKLGFDVNWDERYTFSGYQRFHALDGAGNRVEILCPSG